MNKYFVSASIVAILILALTYLEYIPYYISVTIALCSFFVGMSSSITSAIHEAQKSNNEVQEKSLEALQKSFDGIIKKVENVTDCVQSMMADNKSHYAEVQKNSDFLGTQLIDVTDKVSQLDKDQKDRHDAMMVALTQKSDLLNTSLKDNSTQISRLNDTIVSQAKDVAAYVSQFKTAIAQAASDLDKVIEDMTNNLAQQVSDMLTNLRALSDFIQAYEKSANYIKDTNLTLSNDISKAITTLNSTVPGITKNNRRLIDDLTDTIKENIKDLSTNITNANSDQTKSLTDSEEKLRNSVDNLCNTLSSNLKKLEIDVDDICESVNAMQQLSQAVDNSDKELLAKISKICR